MPEWMVVKTCSYQHEAEFVKSLLEGSGLDAITNSDDCGALDPALGLVRGIAVLVRSDQIELAESILTALPGDLPPDSTSPA
ncbi:MAG: hypothetical protein WCP29_05385 [Acidobacteriota bacterium]